MPVRDKPELRRARARRYVARCNADVQRPYRNIYLALELAEQAYIAHNLEYEPGLSKMDQYPPDRFTWFCDETGEAEDCLKVRDNQTKQVAVFRWF